MEIFGLGFVFFFLSYEHCSNRDTNGETAMKAVTLDSFHRNKGQILHQEAGVLMLMLPGDHAKHGICQLIGLFTPQNPLAADLCS